MPKLDEVYTPEFYEGIRGGSRDSSGQLAPLVVDLVKPDSVVDVGCGDGTWLNAFMKSGVTRVLGIDGDYVKPEDLQIPRERFQSCDLSKPPDKFDGNFDLVISLEVAEHLPPESAAPFVNFLTLLGPVVLFSAAVPGQGGSNHVNEQWQHYWADLFASKGYRSVDCIRKDIWCNESIQYWYRQNTVLYVRNEYIARTEKLRKLLAVPPEPVLPLIHPEFYTSVQKELAYRLQPPSVGKLCTALPGALRRAIGRRFEKK